ncbi:hypothetical protein SK128_024938, partial [Halocaridina rubra]
MNLPAEVRCLVLPPLLHRSLGCTSSLEGGKEKGSPTPLSTLRSGSSQLHKGGEVNKVKWGINSRTWNSHTAPKEHTASNYYRNKVSPNEMSVEYISSDSTDVLSFRNDDRFNIKRLNSYEKYSNVSDDLSLRDSINNSSHVMDMSSFKDDRRGNEKPAHGRNYFKSKDFKGDDMQDISDILNITEAINSSSLLLVKDFIMIGSDLRIKLQRPLILQLLDSLYPHKNDSSNTKQNTDSEVHQQELNTRNL